MRRHALAGLVTSLLFAWGCSPAGDPLGRGTAHYSIDFPVSPLPACGITSRGGIGEGEDVPELPVGSVPPTSDEDYGTQVRDGETIEGSNANYVVRCRVTGGENRRIEVFMEGPNTSPQAGTAVGGTKIDISGTIGANGTGTGNVTYLTTRSGAGSNPSSAPCTLTAAASQDGSGGFQIETGAARFSFLCPETIRSQDDRGRCEAKGTIWVQDCVED